MLPVLKRDRIVSVKRDRIVSAKGDDDHGVVAAATVVPRTNTGAPAPYVGTALA